MVYTEHFPGILSSIKVFILNVIWIIIYSYNNIDLDLIFFFKH